MKVTKEKVLSDYNRLVVLAEKLFAKKRYEDCLSVVKTAAFLMYNFNLIYADERLENLLHKCGDFFVSQLPQSTAVKTVLFYDWWILETRGLSTIYIKGLLQNGYKVIVVTLEQNRAGADWLYKLLGGNGAIEYFNLKDSYKKQLETLSGIYKTHLPKTAFFHTMPDDVAGCVFFTKLPCERFLVNLTDHAFWLGSTCVDYSIEFRDYGYTVSKNHRHIPEEKLIMLPYYPVHKLIPASDMQDFFTTHKNLVVSGGSLYKIAGSPVFLEIVSHILNAQNDSTFAFIGGGNPSIINQFIKENSLENRCFYFTERPDFEDFIRHAKFYLCTYPINGALMSQLAVVNKKLPLCYNPGNDGITRDADMESLFVDTGHNPKLSFNTLNQINAEIDHLFADEKYLKQQEDKLNGMVLSEEDFNQELKKLLEIQQTKFNGKECKVDLDEFAQIYLDAENNTSHNYNLFFARSKSPVIYKLFPGKSFWGVLKILGNKLFTKFTTK